MEIQNMRLEQSRTYDEKGQVRFSRNQLDPLRNLLPENTGMIVTDFDVVYFRQIIGNLPTKGRYFLREEVRDAGINTKLLLLHESLDPEPLRGFIVRNDVISESVGFRTLNLEVAEEFLRDFETEIKQSQPLT